MSLQGKLALITGAGSGIGRAVCQTLARDGASIVAADLNFQTAQDTVKTIDHPDIKNTPLGINVADSKSVQSALKEVLNTYTKPPTIIVNCAGITRDNFISRMSESDFDQVIDINLKGTFLVTQAFANAMVEHQATGGSIINISSIFGKHPNIGQANYSASKAAVLLLTKTAAKEYGRHGIRVNAILPGPIETPMIQTIPDKLKVLLLKQIALGRIGKPEDVAEVIAFLASEKSSYVTGATIDVNGGLA